MKKIYVIESSADPEYYGYQLMNHTSYKNKKHAEELAAKASEQFKVISPKYTTRVTELRLVE